MISTSITPTKLFNALVDRQELYGTIRMDDAEIQALEDIVTCAVSSSAKINDLEEELRRIKANPLETVLASSSVIAGLLFRIEQLEARMENTVPKADFEDDLLEAIRNLDMSQMIEDALENVDLEQMVESCLENIDITEYIDLGDTVKDEVNDVLNNATISIRV